MERIIYAPDPTFTGVCSGVEFNNGVGVCGSDFMAGWLCAKGFAIDPEPSTNILSKPPKVPKNTEELQLMGCGELVELARTMSVSLAGISRGDKQGLIAAIEKGAGGSG